MRILCLLLLLLSCGKGSTSANGDSKLLSPLDRYQIPGLGSMAIKNGQIQELTVTGLRKMGEETLLLSDDKFHLGSCTKAMTATLAAILIEEGKLKWTSTLGELLPDMELHPAYVTMPFETLLVHRAGLSVVKDDWLFKLVQTDAYTSTGAREFMTRTILELTPKHIPGTTYEYSNSHYIIAGYILERVTGLSWETLMQEKLFNPLYMKSCGFGPTSPDNTWAHKNLTPIHLDNPKAFGPAARVHCSLPDWGKFLNEHINGFHGVDGIVKAATFHKLHSQASSDSPYTYGGWLKYQRSWAGGVALTHDGSNTVNYAKAWLAPNLKLILTSTTNTGGSMAQLATENAISEMIHRQISTLP